MITAEFHFLTDAGIGRDRALDRQVALRIDRPTMWRRLGFSPRTLDDRVHRIDVKIVNLGFTVRARRSYFTSAHADAR
jgi:hypothetical protein